MGFWLTLLFIFMNQKSVVTRAILRRFDNAQFFSYILQQLLLYMSSNNGYNSRNIAENARCYAGCIITVFVA